VGQAQKNAGKRRQELAAKRAVAAARQARKSRNQAIITVAVVLVVAAAVVVGVVIANNQKNKTAEADIPTRTVNVAADVPITRDGAAVLVGKDNAKVTLDVYEDFLCPVCGQFESTYADQMLQHVNDGSLRVRYHLVNLLNTRSDPPGYSTDSANAALCVADADKSKFMNFHASLYASQPEEGARGYDKDQLVKLGQAVGVTAPTFQSCVTSSTYDKAVTDAYDQAKNTPYLQQESGGQRGFGTPTVVNGTRVLDWTSPDWLTKALGSQPQ
jgi:protein-disulfide isomerase